MKKITALFLSLITVFALTACGNQSSDSAQEDSEMPQQSCRAL